MEDTAYRIIIMAQADQALHHIVPVSYTHLYYIYKLS